MCNRNSSRLDNNFDPSTIMLKNSCYVFHTVSFDPRRNGAPRNSSKRTFKLHNTTLNSFLILLYGQKRVFLPLLLSFFLFSRELSSLSLPKLKLFRTILTKYKNKIQTDPLCSTDDLYPIFPIITIRYKSPCQNHFFICHIEFSKLSPRLIHHLHPSPCVKFEAHFKSYLIIAGHERIVEKSLRIE